MYKKTILALVAMVFAISCQPQALVAQDVVPQNMKTADDYIEDIFGDKATIAKAVILHESQNKLDAVNYNCVYGGKSTSCRKGDEARAWSVDCGIGQINVRAKSCPEELLTLEGNMDAIEKIYKTQGLNAWVSYKTGRYKRYL